MSMEWKKLLSKSRIGITGRQKDSSEPRTVFEHDTDVVTFSNSFRRMSRKTQVHPFARNAHTHNRLTHSLETASVGRSLGCLLAKKLGSRLPSEFTVSDVGALVQSACLAHDIGNPPFGHAGEDALSEWFQRDGMSYLEDLSDDFKNDIRRFEGNAQGLRMLTQTENYVFEGGLRLTYGVLGAYVKYPWTSNATKPTDKHKFGAFISEEQILNLIAQKTGLISKGKNRWCRHPLAYLTEAADDICYAIIDLEDAVELGVLNFSEVSELLLKALAPDERKIVKNTFLGNEYHRVNFARLRGPVFRVLINAAIDGFMDKYTSIMDGTYEGDFLSLLEPKSAAQIVLKGAKDKGAKNIYNEKFKREIEMGCYSALGRILDAFCKAATERAKSLNNNGETCISGMSKLVLSHMGNHAPSENNAPGNGGWTEYSCLRRTLDFVSGMTDDFAWEMAAKLQGVTIPR